MSEADKLLDTTYQRIFESFPGLYLVLTTEFIVVSVTDDYLKKSSRKRDEIVDRYLFDVFPDNPDDPAANGVKLLTDSLNKVIKEKVTDVMEIIKYDIPISENNFDVKYWKSENSPIFNADGELIYILHKTEDITEFVMLENQRNEQLKINNDLKIKSDSIQKQFNQITEELKSGNFSDDNLDMPLKKAVKELEAERYKLHSLLSNAPAYISLLESPEHIFTFTNPLYQQLIDDRQVIGKTIKEAWPELEGQGFYELLDQVYSTGIPYIGNETPAMIDKGNGVMEQRYMNFVYQPVFDINNQVSGISAYVHDVTEQILARQKLELLTEELTKSENKYKKLTESLEKEVHKRTSELMLAQQKLTSLLMNAPAIICVFEGSEHVFEFTNPNYDQLYGYRKLLGIKAREALPELEGQVFFDLLDKVYNTGEPYIGNEIPATIDRYSNGILENVYFNFVYQPVFDTDKQVRGIAVFAFDITEQVFARQKVEELNRQLLISESKYKSLSESLELKVQQRTEDLFKANKEIKYQRNRLESLLINAPAFICLLEGPEHIFNFTNPLYEKLFGDNLVGKPVKEALPIFASQGYFDILDTVYQTGKPFIASEALVYIDKSGNGNLDRYYFNFVYQPIFNVNNQVEGISSFIYDVTNMVVSRQEVENLNKDLERSNQELQSFAYIASHDLQEPLRTITSYSEIISKRYKNQIDKDAEQFINLIVNAAKRMKYLIENVLDHSKIQKKSGPEKASDLNKIIENIKSNLKLSIEENNVLLSYDKLPLVKAEYSYMTQLFQNLISNSIKYKNKNFSPSIHISVKKENGFYVFSLKDNGIGIAKEYHERIFEIFKRLHSRDEYDGTGIGLASCKKIVELYGGKIWIESEEGKGSTFFFTLPA